MRQPMKDSTGWQGKQIRPGNVDNRQQPMRLPMTDSRGWLGKEIRPGNVDNRQQPMRLPMTDSRGWQGKGIGPGNVDNRQQLISYLCSENRKLTRYLRQTEHKQEKKGYTKLYIVTVQLCSGSPHTTL